ncbi:MAG: hypothetical protein ABFC31_00410 [Clostridiaceae bacterium]
MLSNQEMCSLQDNEAYCLTERFRYNRKYARCVIESGCAGLSLSIASNSSGVVLIDFIRIFWAISKYWRIAREIGEFRNRVIENAYNYDVPTFPILDLMTQKYYWVEANVAKMDEMRRITIDFLSDAKIAQLFYDASSLANKGESYIAIALDIDARYRLAMDHLWDIERRQCCYHSSPTNIDQEQRAMQENTTGGITDGYK